MSRLTYLNQDTETTELTQFEGDSWQELIKNADAVDQIFIHNAIDKLYEYEDLEEQGLLLKLPCPLGTEVYKVREVYYCDFNYDDEVCTRYCKYKCEEGLYCEHQIIKYGISKVLFTINMYNEFNKTIFLTKEEAEKALVRLESAE